MRARTTRTTTRTTTRSTTRTTTRTSTRSTTRRNLAALLLASLGLAFAVAPGHYEAFEVTEDGTLRSVGLGTKSGFCPIDQGYGEWRAFDQDEQYAVYEQQDGDCFALRGDGALGLTAGWGDVYRWQRPGQFVDVTGAGDGTYVVRVTVDIRDNVLESDETDNASYALIEVVGDDVTILERGHGDSPFDPDKVVATDHRDR